MAHMQLSERSYLAIALAGVFSVTSGIAHAAGFALIEQSVSSMGTAYAGAGSAAEDASYIFFNPASMSEFDSTQISAGLHVVLPETEFTGSASYNSASPIVVGAGLVGTPILPVAGASNDTDAGVDGYVPHFAYVRELNDRMNFGLTVNVPFGLKTEYGSGWVGRYSSTEAEILSVNLNPTLSYKVDDRITLGFGLSAMYAELIYQNVLDLGFPGAPGGADLPAKIETDDVGFGWNIGAMLQPTESTRIGVAYRSKVNVELEGDLITPNPAANTSADVEADLPDSFLISAYHEVNPQWAVMADVMWTQWSRINALVIELGTGVINTIPLEWEDTYRVAVGANYKPNEKLTLRGGLAFDETPVPSPEFRPTALPDEDRIWLNLGAGYKLSKNISLDFGYAHLFIDDTDINSSDAYSTSFPVATTEGLHRVTGQYKASVDIVSAQLNWTFN